MSALASIVSTSLLLWLGLLAALIAVRMLNGQIPVSGFLVQQRGGDIAPERMIAIGAFPLVLVTFVYQALTRDIAGMAHPSLPDISNDAIALLTGSNVLYISGKIARR